MKNVINFIITFLCSYMAIAYIWITVEQARAGVITPTEAHTFIAACAAALITMWLLR